MCITRCRTYQPHENTSRAEKTLSKAEGTRNRTTQAHRRVDDGKPFLRPYARLHDGAGCPDRRSGRHSNEPRHHRHAGAGAAVGAISKPASARSGARLSGRGLADFRRAEYLRAVPGVETVALASWPLLSGYSSNDAVAVDGGPPSEDMAFFLNVSPGWVDAMKIPFMDGRDFRAGDTYPGVAIVSETFAKRFFQGKNPVGRWFERASDEGPRLRLQIVGLVRDVRYLDMRGPILPVAYLPFRQVDGKGVLQPVRLGTVIVRTSSANPRALAQILSREVARARPEFRVGNIETQAEINQVHTVRERLLAVLALFFAVVALLLAGVGLYGVLDYSVLQRRREIGIRMAIGAQAGGIARLVTVPVFAMVLAGAVAGLALGTASVRYIESLFYEVKATDLGALAVPSVTILVAAMVAALPAVIRAVRIDPAAMLRAEWAPVKEQAIRDAEDARCRRLTSGVSRAMFARR